MTASDFLVTPTSPANAQSKFDAFKSELATYLGYPNAKDHIQITSMNEGADYLDVMYAAHGSPYLSPSQMESAVMLNQAKVCLFVCRFLVLFFYFCFSVLLHNHDHMSFFSCIYLYSVLHIANA